ncbi:MAG: RDD family protein [Chitinophagales bacterium]|nr:RDD family protein [Chitinophagales bacterium]
MQTIDIITSQNVTIQYALASVRDRLLSFFIDVLVLFVCMMLLVLLFTAVIDTGDFDYVLYLLIFPFLIFYSLVQEVWWNGQSIGKRMTGLKIMKLNGKEPTAGDYLIRWAFRFIDIWFSLGAVALLLISSTERHQRLGDLLAGTAVIKLAPWQTVSLEEVLALHATSAYEPVYTGVKVFSEQEMLLVKQALDRLKFYDNAAHHEAIRMLADKIAGQMSLTAKPEDPVSFLKTVLSDYIVLSR